MRFWLVTVPGGLVLMAILASHLRPLIAASGLAIVAGGVVLARDSGGVSTSLFQLYRRIRFPVTVAKVKRLGLAMIVIGCLWTVLPLASYLR